MRIPLSISYHLSKFRQDPSGFLVRSLLQSKSARSVNGDLRGAYVVTRVGHQRSHFQRLEFT